MLRLTVVGAPAGRVQTGESIVVGPKGATIGRGPDNTWRLEDEQKLLSRVHMEVLHADGGYEVADRSTNGLYVNGNLLGRGNQCSLNHGDEVRLGQYYLRAELDVAGDPGFAITSEASDSPENDLNGDPALAPFDDPEQWLLGHFGDADPAPVLADNPTELNTEMAEAAAPVAIEIPPSVAAALEPVLGSAAYRLDDDQLRAVILEIAGLVAVRFPDVAAHLGRAASSSSDDLAALLVVLKDQREA